MNIKLTINGQKKIIDAAPTEILLDVLRREGFVGVKRGCSEGSCGACVILMDGQPRKSCIMFVGQANHHEITTIEGLGTPEKPHPLQDLFVEEAGIQCGYCIPGMLLSADALLKEVPEPTDEEIKIALSGNLCRCTGYVKQIEAVKKAAKRIREKNAKR